ncbi:MAG: hypothetical protein ABI439_05880 [Rhodospirillales bacterium]
MAVEQKIEKTPVEAKAGVELFRMRYVLGISIALAVAAFIAAFLIFQKS